MDETQRLVFSLILCGIVGSITYLWWRSRQPAEDSNKKQKSASASSTKQSKQASGASSAGGGGGGGGAAAAKKGKAPPTHPLVLCTCKGHTNDVLDFSFKWDGSALITTSEDRMLIVWPLHALSAAPKAPVRVNVEYDHATHVACSANGKAVALILNRERLLEIMFILPDKSGKIVPHVHKKQPHRHKGEILSLHWAKGGQFLVTCSEDTEIKVWNTDCELIESVSTNSSQNFGLAVAPDCCLFAVATFMPEVKVWEVAITKDGAPQKVSKIMTLTGKGKGGYNPHTKPVRAVAYGSGVMATASADGTFKVWNSAVRYGHGEEPHVTFTSKASKVMYEHIAISHDNKMVATHGSDGLHFYTIEGKHLLGVEHTDLHGIVSMEWAPTPITKDDGTVLPRVLGVLHGDGRVRLWNAPPLTTK